jgi:hypothetical protein
MPKFFSWPYATLVVTLAALMMWTIAVSRRQYAERNEPPTRDRPDAFTMRAGPYMTQMAITWVIFVVWVVGLVWAMIGSLWSADSLALITLAGAGALWRMGQILKLAKRTRIEVAGDGVSRYSNGRERDAHVDWNEVFAVRAVRSRIPYGTRAARDLIIEQRDFAKVTVPAGFRGHRELLAMIGEKVPHFAWDQEFRKLVEVERRRVEVTSAADERAPLNENLVTRAGPPTD